MRLKFDTTNPVIRTRRGELYLLKGDLIHAENDFQAALSNTNNVDPEAHFYSAIVKTSIGKHREAIEHYSLAIKNINSRSVLSENAKKVDDFANSFESMRRSVKQTGDSFRVGLTNIFGVNVSII
jgi:tetratricopeptide (TPR) repeat protein